MLELPTQIAPTHRPGNIICGAQCKMKLRGPLFRNYEEFQVSDSRASDQAHRQPCDLHPEAVLPSGA